MRYFIVAEDLAKVVIGPFSRKTEARDHIAFCIDRGDSAEMEIVRQDQLPPVGLILTPEEDREWDSHFPCRA